MKDFFPESLGQKHGCALYTANYGMQVLFALILGIYWSIYTNNELLNKYTY